MKSFVVKLSECVCPRCHKRTLSPEEVLEIREKGRCFDCKRKERGR